MHTALSRTQHVRPAHLAATAGLALLLVGTPFAATAQDSSGNTTAIAGRIEALRACREERNDSARLACFDKATGDVMAALDGGEAKIVGSEEVERTRRGMFGFTMPKLGLFSGKDGEEMEILESTVTGVRRTRSTYELTIAEGSTWRISSPPSRLRAPEIGDPVVFKKAALGSYFIRIDGQTGVKASRTR